MKFLGIFGKKNIKELNEDDQKILSFEKKAIENINFDDSIQETDKPTKKIKKKATVKKEIKHYEGHRARLKQKIAENNIETLPDYELLEAALMYSIPRNDVKPLSKELLKEFNNLKNIFLAPQENLRLMKGIGENTLCFFKIINEIYCRFSQKDLKEEYLLNSPEKVGIYCQARMAHLNYEQFRVLFLNRKNKLIKDEIIQTGTIDKAAIFPRELVKKAMELGAGGMILVHNHPTGNTTPSQADIEITNNIKNAANLMEIFLYDHIIVGKNSYYSMKSNHEF